MTGEEKMRLDFEPTNKNKINELESEIKVLKRVVEKLSMQ
jgi:archaellum component FlaC